MTFPDGNQYQAHPNFHLVAAANTFGTGANQTYNGRNQLDGASLNRFLPVPVDYDTNIEKSLTNNQAILPLYWEVRRIVRENEINYVVSTRNILNADKYLSAKVFPLDKIFEWTLVGSLQDFDLATIISNIGTTDSYSIAFIEFVKRNYNIQIIFIISNEFLLSKFPVGSSAITMFGFFTIALAIDTLCLSPPDSIFAGLFLYLYIFTLSST